MSLGEFIPPLLGITGLVIANYIYKLVKNIPRVMLTSSRSEMPSTKAR